MPAGKIQFDVRDASSTLLYCCDADVSSGIAVINHYFRVTTAAHELHVGVRQTSRCQFANALRLHPPSRVANRRP